MNQIQKRWKYKHIQGQNSTLASNKNIDKLHTDVWLCSAGLKAENEGFILDAQTMLAI